MCRICQWGGRLLQASGVISTNVSLGDAGQSTSIITAADYRDTPGDFQKCEIQRREFGSVSGTAVELLLGIPASRVKPLAQALPFVLLIRHAAVPRPGRLQVTAQASGSLSLTCKNRTELWAPGWCLVQPRLLGACGKLSSLSLSLSILPFKVKINTQQTFKMMFHLRVGIWHSS